MNNIINLARSLVLTLVATCSLSACAPDEDNQVNLRFVNAVSDVYAVDFLLDGDVWEDDVSYLASSDYFTLDTEEHLFQVVPSNSLTPIDNLLTSLADDKDYTYIAIGSALDATALMLVDDNQSPGSDSFKLRIIDAMQSSLSLNVYVLKNAQDIDNMAPAAKNLRYRSVTNYLTGVAGLYSIVITNSRTGDVVARASEQIFNNEDVYTMVIAQSPVISDGVYIQILNDTDPQD